MARKTEETLEFVTRMRHLNMSETRDVITRQQSNVLAQASKEHVMILGLINANGEQVPMASILQSASEAGRNHPESWTTYTEYLRMIYGLCDTNGRGLDREASRIMRRIKKAFEVVQS